jgi:hypothetical protein
MIKIQEGGGCKPTALRILDLWITRQLMTLLKARPTLLRGKKHGYELDR